jgi:hypothetical protein
MVIVMVVPGPAVVSVGVVVVVVMIVVEVAVMVAVVRCRWSSWSAVAVSCRGQPSPVVVAMAESFVTDVPEDWGNPSRWSTPPRIRLMIEKREG